MDYGGRMQSRAGWHGALLLLIGAGMVGLALGVAAAPPNPDTTGPNLPRGNRVPWQAGSYYLTGVNYPFYGSYGADLATLKSQDLSCNWAEYNAFDYAAIDRDFATMSASGVRVVRWFVFGDGRGGVYDNHNYMTGLDAGFYAHMDQVLEIAARHNIYLIWSLWDYLMFEQGNWLCGGASLDAERVAAAGLPPSVREQYEAHLRLAIYKNPWNADGTLKPLPPRGAQPDTGQYCPVYAGGHRNIITDIGPDGAQDHFFRDVLSPMLRRYAGNPYIVGWEAMNEPEWALSDGTGQQPTITQPVTLAQMRAFFARFAAQVHADAPGQYATVGSASLKWSGGDPNLNNVNLWQGLGLDYYQIHFYGWMESTWNHFSPMNRDYNTDPALVANLDAPAIVGEFPANGGQPPIYLPLVRRGSGGESSTLRLRALCQHQPQDGPCTTPITATIRYYAPTGDPPVLTQTVVLPPNGMWQGDVPPPPLTSAWTGSARVEATGGVAGTISQTAVLAGIADNLAYPSQEGGATTLFVPAVYNLADGHRTRLALQNTDVQTATVMLTYYSTAGVAAGTSQVTLPPRGMTLVPDLQGTLPPVGFSGSALISSSAPVAGVAQELDPTTGVAAALLRPDSYLNTEYLPGIRNDGTDVQFLRVLNGRDMVVQVQIAYYDAAGVPLPGVAGDTFTLGPHAQASISLAGRLPGGFNGSATVTGSQKVFTQIAALSASAHVLALHDGQEGGGQFFHFPAAHKTAAGWGSTITALNLDATQPVTFNVMLDDAAGGEVVRTVVVPPHAQWDLATGGIPNLPDGFDGTAQAAWFWPWQTGWNSGFPLLAIARHRLANGSAAETANGIQSGLLTWAMTGLTPGALLDRAFANNWAGGLAWSFYEGGTGHWSDYVDAQRSFSQAHPAAVDIRPLQTPTPTRTPGNGATATAQAFTPTPAYGNSATATAAAATPTPGAPCCTGVFADVDPNAYFAAAVRYLSCGGFVSGYPCGGPGEPCDPANTPYFRPFANTTRGQFTKILVLGRGWPLLNPATPSFTDVSPGNAFYPFVETAAGRGIISGYACGGSGEPCDPQYRPYFRPYNNITRGQLSKLVMLGLSWPVAPPADPAYTFADVPRSHPFFAFIETIVAHGIASGYQCGGPGEPCDPQQRPYFRAGANGTRGQLSKMLHLALTNP